MENEKTEFFYVPLGVGVVISPWNFPLALTIGMLSAAVVTGNTAIVKPSSNSPTTVAWLVALLKDAALPAGVVSYLTGPGSDLRNRLVDDPRVLFVAFTCSRVAGLEGFSSAVR